MSKQTAFDFNRLLKPYQEAGTENNKVTRTMGLIIDYLVNKKKYGIDIVGAAIMIVFWGLYSGKKFVVDGSYGSAGRELVTNIRMVCDAINRERLASKLYKKVAESRFEDIKIMVMRAGFNMLPWFVKMWSVKYWKFKLWQRRTRKEIENHPCPVCGSGDRSCGH